jgi:hypothetical protein
MKTNKKKKSYEQAILDSIPDDVIPRGEETPEDVDAYKLAMLAAQIRPGLLHSTKDFREAIKTAWELLKEARFNLRQIDIEKRVKENLPQLEAESLEQDEKRLAAVKIPYQRGVELITGYMGKEHWDRALEWFKKFLVAKAKKEAKTETWVGAKLGSYRVQGFTGLQRKNLGEEFREWREHEYRGQGRVTKETDLRLKKNKPKTTAHGRLEYHENLDAVQVRAMEAEIGSKTPRRKPDYDGD